MKKNIKVAILDTGINATHPYLTNNIKRSYDVIKGKKYYQINLLENNNFDNNGHGTACASVIKSLCNDVDIYSFKILDERGICSVLKLEKVLSYIEEIDVDIINLSLSIVEKASIKELESICDRLWKKNKLVVASLGNGQKRGYPAILKNCIGVQGSILKTMDSIWFCSYKKIQCVVDNTPFLHCNKEGNYSMFGKCNSYSAAKLSGIIASVANHRNMFDVEEIMTELTDMSERKYWSGLELRKSKRFPDIMRYKDIVDEDLTKEVEEMVKEYFHFEKNFSLSQAFLFSREIGLTYECCYKLLKVFEQKFKFIVDDYTNVSREDFYSIYSIARMIQYYSKEKEYINYGGKKV